MVGVEVEADDNSESAVAASSRSVSPTEEYPFTSTPIQGQSPLSSIECSSRSTLSAIDEGDVSLLRSTLDDTLCDPLQDESDCQIDTVIAKDQAHGSEETELSPNGTNVSQIVSQDSIRGDVDVLTLEAQCDSPVETYKFVFDNIDKTVKPRYMRLDSQAKSLHYVQLYAVKNRIPLYHLSPIPPSVSEINLSVVLPSDDDIKMLLDNLTILIARIMVKRILYFSEDFKTLLPTHILHKYSGQMAKKSEVHGE